MANTQVANVDVTRELGFSGLTSEDVATIRNTVAKDCNDQEFKLFMAQARAMDASPLLQETWPVIYVNNDKKTRQLTIHYAVALYERKAKEFKNYGGITVEMVHENDEFEMHYATAEKGRTYAIIDVHKIKFPRGKVVGAYGFAYDTNLDHPYSIVMDVEEVAHFTSPNNKSYGQKNMWTQWFIDMFKKHIKKRLLKTAFGLVVPDDSDESSTIQMKDMGEIVPDAPADAMHIPTMDDMDIPESPKVEIVEPKKEEPKQQQTTATNEYGRLRNEVYEKFHSLEINGKENQENYMADAIPGFERGKKPTTAQLKQLIVSLDADIEDKE